LTWITDHTVKRLIIAVMWKFQRCQKQHTDYFGCWVPILKCFLVQCEFFMQKLLLCYMCISFFVTCKDVNPHVQKIKPVPYSTKYSRFWNAVSNCLTVKLFYIHTPRFHFGHMNTFLILTFIHDEDKFFAYYLCILTFCITFLNFIFISSC